MNPVKNSDASLTSAAKNSALDLNPDRLTVANVLKDFYAAYQTHPNMRVLIRHLEHHWGADKANSRYLYRLFPEGPVIGGSRLAGLPKPARCV